jgi:hypothetical protein
MGCGVVQFSWGRAWGREDVVYMMRVRSVVMECMMSLGMGMGIRLGVAVMREMKLILRMHSCIDDV